MWLPYFKDLRIIMHSQTVTTLPMLNPKKTPLAYKILVVMAMMILMGGSLIGLMTYINIGFSETFPMIG